MSANLERLDQRALDTVAGLATRARALECHAAELELQLKETNEELRRVLEDSLPQAMTELGLTQLRLGTGEAITVKDEVHCGIPRAQEIAALNWLREHELGDVIKSNVTVTFGRGDDSKAAAALKVLAELKCDTTTKVSVHPQTLKALAREKIEAGDPLPEDLFGVHIINRAIIKRS